MIACAIVALRMPLGTNPAMNPLARMNDSGESPQMDAIISLNGCGRFPGRTQSFPVFASMRWSHFLLRCRTFCQPL